jgi:DNA end-binding protein Ku
MLEAKLAGEELRMPEPVEEEAPVVDLMEALRRSVEEAKKGKPATAAAKKPAAKPRKRATAKS